MVDVNDVKTAARIEFGQRLRVMREAKFGKRSLTMAAGAQGITPQFLSKVERGETAPLTEDRINRAVELYEPTAEQLQALLDAASRYNHPGKIVILTDGQPESARVALLRIAALPRISAGLAQRLLEVVETEATARPAAGDFTEPLVA